MFMQGLQFLIEMGGTLRRQIFNLCRLLLTQLLRADQALLGGLQQASGLIRKTDVVAEKPSGPLGCPGSGTAVGSR